MALPKTRFSRKLNIAFATLMAITLALAWYFYDSVKWYEHDVQRINLANNVLHHYQSLSELTFQQLNDLGDQVFRQEAEAPEVLKRKDELLRMAVTRVRQGIAAELAFEQNVREGLELEALVEVDRVLEEIVRTRADINQALLEGETATAEQHLSRLRNAGVTGFFSNMITAAISEQRREVRNAEQDAVSLSRYITKALPVMMAVLVLLTLWVIMRFSRSLTKSVGALHEGVRAFTAGNLSHRIPGLREREFWRLGDAFNTMARELTDHRRQLHDSNVTLEAKVEERTRALKSSNRKLANVDVNRRKLLADISHEFRTPLTVIRGEAEIALRGKNRTKEDYRDSFRRIMDQADHTTRLVDDLLFIARVDAGEPRLTLRSVAMAKMIESVCEDFGAKAEQKEINIQYACEDKDAIVMGDAGRLRQVFAILMDNALRYSNRGGEVNVSLQRTDDEILIQVKDQGIGLTEEESEQVFERFYRGPKAEEHARGNGLGLPVAKAILDAHNGTIRLDGQPGKGAVATVIMKAESRLRVVA